MQNMTARLLTVAEVARNLATSEKYVRREIKAGRLAAFRLGGSGQYRISEQAVAELVAHWEDVHDNASQAAGA